MLPDPLALRGAASTLTATGTEVRRLSAQLTATLRDVSWSAPAADVVRRDLASAAAGALTGCVGLEAGGVHLRAVAQAIEDLRDTARQLHGRAAEDLRSQAERATAAGATDVAEAARRALAALKGPDDPTWAGPAGARPVALPATGTVPTEPVPPSPAGLVFADLDRVRRLAAGSRSTASAESAACSGVASRMGALGLAGLDEYGLGGSRSAQWLTAMTAPGAPLTVAAGRWELAARECDLLVSLLASADRPGELLADPRLLDAFGVLAAQLAGPAALRAALAAVSPAELAWLVDVVPGLSAPQPTHSLKPPGMSWWDPGDWLHSAWQGVSEVVERLDVAVNQMFAEATAVMNAARALSGEGAEAGRAAARLKANALLAAARKLDKLLHRWRQIEHALHMPDWLRRAATEPAGSRGLLRGLTRVGIAGAVLGLVLDLLQGTSPRRAVVKAVLLVGVGLLIGMGVAGLITTGPIWLPVLAEMVISTAVVMAVGWAFDNYGDQLWSGVTGLGKAALRRVGPAVAATRRFADRAERQLAGLPRRLSNLVDGLPDLGPSAVAHRLGRLSPFA